MGGKRLGVVLDFFIMMISLAFLRSDSLPGTRNLATLHFPLVPLISYVLLEYRMKSFSTLEREDITATPDQTLYVWQEAGLAQRHDPRALAFPVRSLSADADAGKRTPNSNLTMIISSGERALSAHRDLIWHDVKLRQN